jgi:hypothetical protein
MSKVYVDGYFFELLDYNKNICTNQISNYCQFNKTNWISSLPDDCDIVAISFYTNDFNHHDKVIDQILPKTKKLVVNFSEPTDQSIISYIKNKNNDKLKIFSDIIVNADNRLSYKTNISWFMGPTNYYSKNDNLNSYLQSSWADSILAKVKPFNYNSQRKKMFDCLLGSRRRHRDVIEQWYNNSAIKDKFFFTYFKEDLTKGIWTEQVDSNSREYNTLIDNIEVSRFVILPYNIYNESYYSIIAETTAFNSYSQFTEKIAKPILAKRPFIVFCGQYYLRNLRSLGFRTFDEIIDESYDSESDNLKRWSMAWNQILYLSKMDPCTVYARANEILEYNYKHFVEHDWREEIKKEF